jgi:hypothetical protein
MTADEFLALYEQAIIRSEGEIWAKRKNPFERVVASIRSCFYRWFAGDEIR